MKAARVLGFVVVGIAAIGGAVVFGQSATPQQDKQNVPLPALVNHQPPGYVVQEFAPGRANFFARQDQSAQLVDQYRKAEKEDDKKEIRKKLAEELGKQFDAHMKQQQDELTALEKQIADLKAIMKKRQEAKTTIIDRRMDQLIQDAEGLGWTTPGGAQHIGLWAQPNPYFPPPRAPGRVTSEPKK